MNSEVLRTGRFAKNRKNKHKPKDPECEQAEAFKFGLILAADDLGQTKAAVGMINVTLGIAVLLPGDTIAGLWFLGVYNWACDGIVSNLLGIRSTCKWLRRALSDNECARPALLAAGNDGIDVSFTSFADDFARKRVVHDVSHLVRSSNQQCQQVQWFMDSINVSINDDKLCSLLSMFGTGSNSALRLAYGGALQLPGGFYRSCRYLGVHLQFNGSRTTELTRRCAAGRSGFGVLGSFWSKCGSAKHKRCVFQCMVDSSLLSGIKALAVPKSFLRKLDSVQASLCRKVVGGQGCAKTYSKAADGVQDNVSFAAISNDEVLKLLRLTPVSIQLSIHRINFFKTWVRRPELHLQEISALFGQIVWPSEICDDEGNIVGSLVPWWSQVLQDITALSAHSELDMFIDEIKEQPSLLFTDEFVRDTFLSTDPKVLASAFLSHAYAPPGMEIVATQTQTPASAAEPTCIEEEFPCVCNIVVGESICGRRFQNYQQLATHQVRSKAAGHGDRLLANVLTVANRCLLCCKPYASKVYAARHLQQAFLTNTCPNTEGSCTVFDIIEKPPYWCSICDISFNTYIEAQTHLRTHIPDEFKRECTLWL